MFMVCNDNRCLAPEYVNFSFILGSALDQVETKDIDEGRKLLIS